MRVNRQIRFEYATVDGDIFEPREKKLLKNIRIHANADVFPVAVYLERQPEIRLFSKASVDV